MKTEPRTYVIGLPVIVTVHDDGRVEYEVDTAETGVCLWEDVEASERYSQEQIQADAERADDEHRRRSS